MKDAPRNFLIGLTAIVALVGLTVLLLMFGELDRVVNRRYEISIIADSAAGLTPGSHVELNGVPIGVIDRVDVRSGNLEYPVRVVARIDHDVPVPARVVPYSETSLLGGSAVLQLILPMAGTEPGPALVQDGTAQIRGSIRYRLFEQINAELDSRMQPLLASLEQFNELSRSYRELGENLNKLVMQETEGGGRLSQTIDQINTTLADVSEAIELAKAWLGDEQLRADARSAVANANHLIEKAAEAIDHYVRLADQLGDQATRTGDRIVEVADELAATLENVRGLVTLAKDGDGTLGLLLNNPDLYRSLNDAAIRLERTLIEIQLFFQKMKAEGIDIKM